MLFDQSQRLEWIKRKYLLKERHVMPSRRNSTLELPRKRVLPSSASPRRAKTVEDLTEAEKTKYRKEIVDLTEDERKIYRKAEKEFRSRLQTLPAAPTEGPKERTMEEILQFTPIKTRSPEELAQGAKEIAADTNKPEWLR